MIENNEPLFFKIEQSESIEEFLKQFQNLYKLIITKEWITWGDKEGITYYYVVLESCWIKFVSTGRVFSDSNIAKKYKIIGEFIDRIRRTFGLSPLKFR